MSDKPSGWAAEVEAESRAIGPDGRLYSVTVDERLRVEYQVPSYEAIDPFWEELEDLSQDEREAAVADRAILRNVVSCEGFEIDEVEDLGPIEPAPELDDAGEVELDLVRRVELSAGELRVLLSLVQSEQLRRSLEALEGAPALEAWGAYVASGAEARELPDAELEDLRLLLRARLHPGTTPARPGGAEE